MWLLHLPFFLFDFIFHCSGNKWMLNTHFGKCFIYVRHQKLCKYTEIMACPPLNDKIHLLIITMIIITMIWCKNNVCLLLLDNVAPLNSWVTSIIWWFLVEFLLTPLVVCVWNFDVCFSDCFFGVLDMELCNGCSYQHTKYHKRKSTSLQYLYCFDLVVRHFEQCLLQSCLLRFYFTRLCYLSSFYLQFHSALGLLAHISCYGEWGQWINVIFSRKIWVPYMK